MPAYSAVFITRLSPTTEHFSKSFWPEPLPDFGRQEGPLASLLIELTDVVSNMEQVCPGPYTSSVGFWRVDRQEASATEQATFLGRTLWSLDK